MKNLEIRKVTNGYIVHPAYDRGCGYPTDGSEMNVFETFDALVVFLREKLTDTVASKPDTTIV